MLGHSLARLVLVLQWTSISALIAVTFLLAGQEWLAYADAGRIVVLTRADRVLFHAMTGIRFENGAAGVAVLSDEQPQAAVAASNHRVDLLFAAAMESLADTAVPGRAAAQDAARAAYEDLQRQRSLIAALMEQPLGERDMATAERWLMAMYALVERLGTAATAVANTVRLLDPEIAELVYVRRSAYVIRDHFGKPCSALRPDVQRNQPLDRARMAAWREWVGVYTSRWDELALHLDRPGAPAQLVEDVRQGRAATAAAQKRMDDIVYGLDGSGTPAIAPADWSHLCTDAYGPILALGNHALDLAVARAETLKARASALLAAMVVLAAASLLLGALSIRTVRRRLSRPLARLMETIGRLSRQEFATPVPATGHPDEIGAMAGALEDLRTSALRAQHLQRLLDEARTKEIERANEVSRAKSAFLATMGHEVRTPLNGILGMAELLRDSPLSAEQRRWLDAITGSGALLLAILNDILDYSKIEAGRLELESIPFSPEEVVRTLEATVAPQAAGKGLAFRCACRPLPARLAGDPAKLGQVLLNLLGNAVKFTHAGEVVLAVRRLDGDGGADRARLEFRVSDTGIGIAPDALAHVFDAFTQSDSSITRRYGGTGLGLAICKRIVEAMGGSLSVVSIVDRGSAFTLTLDFPVLPAAVPPPAAGAAPLPRLSVLLAEDNAVNAAVVTAMLGRLGHAVVHAADGAAALALAAEADYDLVMTDLAMPGLDGIGLARRIRALPHATRCEVPIVALTADVAAERADECFAAGMTDILRKPFRRDELLRVLADATGAAADDEEDGAAAAPPGGRRSLLEERLEDLGAAKTGFIVELFVRTTPPLLAEAARAAAAGDAAAFAEAAHRLKSAAGQLGLHRLARLARDGERAGAAGDGAAVRRAAAAIAAAAPGAVAAVQRAWRGVLSARDRRSGSPPRAP
ncbi:ATP-binding protein [Azospirillum sp. ST 5-10]|uniref:ATP-binding protein n=1 Tax=unclassified Azospirillum TaxID=2630922 RepID=UPI003F4A6AF1